MGEDPTSPSEIHDKDPEFIAFPRLEETILWEVHSSLPTQLKRMAELFDIPEVQLSDVTVKKYFEDAEDSVSVVKPRSHERLFKFFLPISDPLMVHTLLASVEQLRDDPAGQRLMVNECYCQNLLTDPEFEFTYPIAVSLELRQEDT